MLVMQYLKKTENKVETLERKRYEKSTIDNQLVELKSLKSSFPTYIEKMFLLSFSALIETEVGKYEISREFENEVRDRLVLPVIRDDELRNAEESLRRFFRNVGNENEKTYDESNDPIYQFYLELENDADLKDNFKNLQKQKKESEILGGPDETDREWYRHFFRQLSKGEDENGNSYQKIFPLLRGNPYLKFAFIYLLISDHCKEEGLWDVLIRMLNCVGTNEVKVDDNGIQFYENITICKKKSSCDKAVVLDLDESQNSLNYVCFYAICTFLRRKHQPKLLDGFIKKYENDFKKTDDSAKNGTVESAGFTSYDHIRLESIKSEDIREDNLAEAERLVSEMNGQAGAKMMYGNMVADYCEEYPNRYEERNVRRHIEKALKKLSGKDDHLTRYPKTHIIKARLLALQKNYQSALESAKEGIKLQRAHEKDNDYMERLTAFYDIRMTIEVEEQVEKIRDVERKMEGQELKNLEMLSIFTAVIGLLTGVFSLVSGGSKLETSDIVSIIITLGGAILVAYSFFYALTHSRDLRKNREMKVYTPTCIVCGGVMLGIVLIFRTKIFQWSSDVLNYFNKGGSGVVVSFIITLSGVGMLVPSLVYIVMHFRSWAENKKLKEILPMFIIALLGTLLGGILIFRTEVNELWPEVFLKILHDSNGERNVSIGITLLEAMALNGSFFFALIRESSLGNGGKVKDRIPLFVSFAFIVILQIILLKSGIRV